MGDSYLWKRCYQCGHTLAFPSTACPQCNTEFDAREDPQPWPDTCGCDRCVKLRAEAAARSTMLMPADLRAIVQHLNIVGVDRDKLLGCAEKWDADLARMERLDKFIDVVSEEYLKVTASERE